MPPAANVQLRMQDAGWSADVERWESDEDSDQSEEERDRDVDAPEGLQLSEMAVVRLGAAAGLKRRLLGPALTTPPRLPAGCLVGPSPLRRTPERRLNSLKTRRGLRSSPQSAPKLRTLPLELQERLHLTAPIYFSAGLVQRANAFYKLCTPRLPTTALYKNTLDTLCIWSM